MAGPVYNFVWLFLCTLYPAYASFKAVKTKNVKEYVKCMMYWIVFALFSAVESFTDPLGTIFVPFYTEMKVILLLYLSMPLTRGSGVVYRRWVHPLLCSREEEIDKMLEALQEQGVSTAKLYMARAAQYLGGVIVNTAVRSGGGLVQSLRNSYSLTDLTQSLEWSRGRFTDLTEESAPPGRYSQAELSSPGLRRRGLMSAGAQEVTPFGDRRPGPGLGRVLSSESLSSGYSTDQYLPVDSETLDTEDYELWERRYHSPQPQRQRQWRNPVGQREETFYEPHQPQYGRSGPDPRPEVRPDPQLTSPYPASEYSDWESETTSEGDKTPTRTKEARSLTVEELQEAARKLNLCLVTPETESPPAVPPRQSQGNENQPEDSLEPECMNLNLVRPTSNTVCAPDLPTDTDNTDSTSSDDESDCQTVRTNDKKGFVQTEMKFRDIYDDTVAILPSSSGDNLAPSAEQITTPDVPEAPEETVQKDRMTLSSHQEPNIPDPSPLYEKNSASTETLKTQNSDEAEPGERKPRSSKKSRAPAPPVQQTASSLLSPSDHILHLSPPTSRRQADITPPDQSPVIEPKVISATLGAENGKVIYRSKGFDGETDTRVADALPQRVVLESPSCEAVESAENEELPAEPSLETQSTRDQFPDKDWRFLGQQEIDQKNLLKPVQETVAPLAEQQEDPVREMYPTMSPSTRLFTYSPSTGVTKLRKYDLEQEYRRPSSPPVRGERPASPVVERPQSPLLPRSEYYRGEEGGGRCPHCTIHSWLPHSPGCLNKR